jgi:hypothetical protein
MGLLRTGGRAPHILHVSSEVSTLTAQCVNGSFLFEVKIDKCTSICVNRNVKKANVLAAQFNKET